MASVTLEPVQTAHDMIANARMYSVSPAVGELWRRLLLGIARRAGLAIEFVEHAPPAPIADLWQREDKAAVFMCGLPYSRSTRRPTLVAAPVPSPGGFRGEAQYWSELVVRADSPFATLEDTFGYRIAFTAPESQSGYVAALHNLMPMGGTQPLYREIVAPRVTPLGALTAVTDGLADVAPIDAYAFALLSLHRPELTNRVRIVARTKPTPIPPLVASHDGLQSLQSAFLEAHADPELGPLFAGLLLERFVRPDAAPYDGLRDDFETTMAFWRTHPLAHVTHPAFVL